MKTKVKFGYCFVILILFCIQSTDSYGQVKDVKEINETVFDYWNAADPNTGELVKIIYPTQSIEDGLWRFFDNDFNFYSFYIKNDSIINHIVRVKMTDYIEERHFKVMEISSQPDTVKWFDFDNNLIKIE